ncbi:flavodoxin [Candidatus Saccharibacteria bacterium]|nr:flavodoxin [Candidatus Saccharibacteria bacterium]
MSKSLVVYFSRGNEEYNVGNVEVGNTELLAKEIVAKTGADEFKIVPETAYPTSYQECVEKATEEQTSDARPKYVGDIDTANYDTIFLGYPIWWGDLPMIVYTFLDNHDLSGKTIIPFNTHEGSGNSGTYEKLKGELANSTVIGDGFNMSGAVARTDEGIKKLDEWLENLGQSL